MTMNLTPSPESERVPDPHQEEARPEREADGGTSRELGDTRQVADESQIRDSDSRASSQDIDQNEDSVDREGL